MPKKPEDETKRKTEFLRHECSQRSGLEGIELEILHTAADLFVDLMSHHWTKIRAICESDEKSTVAISFGFDLDNSGARPLVRARIGYAQKYKDEAEALVDDPDQVKLPFGEASEAAEQLRDAMAKHGGGSISFNGKTIMAVRSEKERKA